MIDVDAAGPGRVVGIEDQRAEVVLIHGRGYAAAQAQGSIQPQGVTCRDFDGPRIGRRRKIDDAGGRNVSGGAESGGARRRIQADAIGRITKLGVRADGKHTLVDRDVSGEGVAGITQHERTRARLAETSAAERTRQLEALGDVGNGGRVDRENRRRHQGSGSADRKTIAVSVRQIKTEFEIRDGRDRKLLVGRCREGQCPAGPADDQRRDDAGVEINRPRDGQDLRRRGAIAVMQQGDGIRIAERSRVEVAGIAFGVEGDGPGARDVEAGDLGDVRNFAHQGDRQVRALDRDGRRTGPEPCHRAVEAERAGRVARIAEGRRAGPGQDVTDGAVRVVDQQAGSRRHRDQAEAERTGNTAAALRRSGGNADDDAAAAYREPVEFIDRGKLEESVASLDHADSAARDDRADIKRGMDIGVDDRGTRHLDRCDRDGVSAGSKHDRASGDSLRISGVAGSSRDRARGRERETGTGAQGDTSRRNAARVGKGKRRQGVGRAGRQVKDAASFDGDHIGAMNRAGGVDIDLRNLVLAAAHDGEAAGREHHVARGGRGDGKRATVDLRASGEIVRRGEDDGVGAVLDEPEGRASAVIPEARVDREGVLIAEDDQLAHSVYRRPACGDHASRRGRAERRGVVVVATEQAALLQVEHVTGGREGEIEREASGEPERTRRGASRRQGDRPVCGRGELGNLTGAEITVIAEEASLADRTDAKGEIIGGVVTRVGDSPRTEEAAEHGRGRGGEEESGVIAGLT